MKKLLVILLILSSTMMTFALDDQGNPNDPTVNERANACYEDGSMAGKCDTDWEWEAGWYLIRFEFGLISLEDFPSEYAILINHPEAIDEAHPTGPGCVRWTDVYIDFGNQNHIAAPFPVWLNSSCAGVPQSTNTSYIGGIVYTRAGIAAANAICQEKAGTNVRWELDVNVYSCENP